MKTLTLLAIGLVAFATSCATPNQRAAKAIAKVNTLQTAQLTNKVAQAGMASVYVHGADWSLQSTNTNRLQRAGDLLGRAESLLPTPTTADTLAVKKALTNDNWLTMLDQRAFGQQAAQQNLERRLASAEAKSDQEFTSIAGEANTWHKLKSWAWWVGGGLLGLFGLTLIMPALSIAFPAFAPFGAIIGNIAGALLKIPFKLIPQAVKGAGFVAAEVHEKTDDTVKALVLAIEKSRQADPNVKAVLETHLKDATSRDWERPVIDAAKAQLNLK